MKITKIGNITYQEGQDERVWLHLIIVNESKPPVIYATVAPNISLAVALAGVYGKVWDTWSLQSVMDALVKSDSDSSLGMDVDISGVRM